MRPAFVIALISAGLALDVSVGAEPPPPPGVQLRATARLADPAPVPFASTVLGRATHRVRLALGNLSAEEVRFVLPPLRWSATRGAVGYPCEDATSTPRGTIKIAPRSSTTLDANVTCDLPLPGDYDVTVALGRAVRASFVVTITSGPNAPVRLGWDPRAWVAVTGTREVRPGRAEARVVLATINGSNAPIAIEPFLARVRLLAPGSRAAVCPDQIVPIEIRGEVLPGRAHQGWTTIECRAPTEGTYAVDVGVLRAGGEVQSVSRYALRVRSGPLLPLPQ